MRVTWVLLTFNRAKTVQEAVLSNIERCGYRPDEIIWVDNGSSEHELGEFMLHHVEPDVAILNKVNLGVAKGYNRGTVLATGDLILITGCDRLMPDNWCERMREPFLKSDRFAAISCYSSKPESVPERYPGGGQIKSEAGIEYIDALPFEARMFRRSLLAEVGYLREDLGLYGWEDVIWGPRYLNVAWKNNLICATFPDFTAVHLGRQDNPDYRSFKDAERNAPWKQKLVNEEASKGYPYYSPYV
jgi:GT2 family glycosyltransferase